jgi:hypothetical protein
MSRMDLSESEIRMLIESLEHCLATCHNEKKETSGVCSDCEAAKALRQRLLNELST